jgi:hypothetical protein
MGKASSFCPSPSWGGWLDAKRRDGWGALAKDRRIGDDPHFPTRLLAALEDTLPMKGRDSPSLYQNEKATVPMIWNGGMYWSLTWPVP